MLFAEHLPSALPAPFPLLTAEGMLEPEMAPQLRADFPRYRGDGFFPYETADCGPVLRALVDLNADWPHGDAGALRFLADAADIEAQVAPQVRPVYGNLVAFRRTARS